MSIDSSDEAESGPPAAEEATSEPAGPAATSWLERRLARLRALVRWEWIKRHYCEMDPRTAGVYRIAAGFLATCHAERHWEEARRFYSNEGVLTNHYHLFRPSSGYNFSLYHAFSSLGEVHVAFALSVLCHLLMMVGFRARLFTIVSFVLVTSLDNRLVMVENGGYVVVNLVLFYAMFLPVERRFSLDALARSYRERKERTVADLNERYRPGWAVDRYVSLAVLLVVLNLSIVYFFNVINKSGMVWRRGETVHYVMYLNRMVTGLTAVIRDHLPMWSTRVISWSVIVLEALLVPWILSPFARRVTRPIAMIGVFALHFTFGIMMRLGPFSWFMIGWSTCLLAPEQWDALERWHLRRAAPRVVVYDRASPLAFALMRFLARLDGLALLTFEESPPEVPSPELFEARDPAGAGRFTGASALREIAQVLPGGRFAFPVLRALGIGAIVALMARRRADLARFFALTLPPRGAETRDTPSPLRRSLRDARMRVREMALFYVTACFVIQAVDENKAIPPQIEVKLGGRAIKIWEKPAKPHFVDATLGYPRMYQGWGMFAPNPITDDGSVTVDARTIDGRRIDPFTGREPDLDISDSQGLGLNQIRQDYFNRIRLDRNRVYRQGLQEYLHNWHHETGRPEDELVAFDVYWVRAQCPALCTMAHPALGPGFRLRWVPSECPPPEHRRSYDNEIIAILAWRKPGYKPPPGQPPIPPEPKVESAETKQPEPTVPGDSKK